MRDETAPVAARQYTEWQQSTKSSKDKPRRQRP